MHEPVSRLAHAVLMPSFVGPAVPGWLLEAVGDGLGGVCYFSHNIESQGQVRALSDAIRAAGPVVTALDEEGGTVTRLHARTGSPHVGSAVLGRTDDLLLTRQVARLVGDEVRAAGVDLDLAPVVDVNSNPANPVIGVRSFGADPDLVARHAGAFVTELQSAGVAACAKHFPGHGDTAVDSHLGLPVIDVDLARLRSRDLPPFAAVVEAGVRCVMTAHTVFGALDSRPATVSPAVIALLREELGFDGVVVSDAMDMGAITDTIGFAEGVVQAVAAGVDLVALGNPGKRLVQHESDEAMFEDARDALVAAVESGRLPVARLTEAAERVRSLAAWCRERPDLRDDLPGGSSAPDVAAARALRTRGEVAGVLSGPARVIDVRNSYNRASGRSATLLADEIRGRIPGSTVESGFEVAAGSAGGGPVVLLTETPGRDDVEDAALKELLRSHRDATVICLGWSGSSDDLPLARNAVFAFGDSLPTARAVVDLLVP